MGHLKVDWSAEAEAQLFRILEERAAFSRSGAERLLRTIIRRTRILADFPQAGPTVSGIGDVHVRQMTVEDYRVLYRLTPDGVEIIAIFHGRTAR